LLAGSVRSLSGLAAPGLLLNAVSREIHIRTSHLKLWFEVNSHGSQHHQKRYITTSSSGASSVISITNIQNWSPCLLLHKNSHKMTVVTEKRKNQNDSTLLNSTSGSEVQVCTQSSMSALHEFTKKLRSYLFCLSSFAQLCEHQTGFHVCNKAVSHIL